MPGVNKIDHNGTEILYIDYRGCRTDEEMIAILHEAQKVVSNEYSSKPYLQLTDLSNTFTTREYMKELKSVAKTTPQTATKRAVVGIDSPGRKILLHAYNIIMGKKAVKPFDSLEDAKAWLVS